MSSLPKSSPLIGAPGSEPARRAPTIDDVAALAGVGRATVSRALNDQAHVSPRMREKVLRAVEALDYRVNPQARNLASRTSKTLTLINCNSRDAPPNSHYFAAIEMGALRAAAAAGFELLTYSLHIEDEDRDDRVVELFAAGRTAGLVLSPPLSADVALALRLIAQGCPAVCISPGNDVSALLPSIGFDEEAAGYEIARHVIAAGHRRFGYMLGIEGHPAAERRHDGFMRALAEAGLSADAVTALRGDFSFKSGVDLAEEMLAGPQRPTAIVCANDDMAVGTMFAAQRMGLALPADLTVVGFDDAPVTGYIWPPLTTIHQPIRQMAARAVERLVETLLRGHGVMTPGLELVAHHLVPRDSVAPPRN
ncbi:LacI family DNA-binding transcriptional regulator [Sphingomonas sp. OTU376]|uniref:LacI family DNA-binding transcriptional regulator n=1 Tax=Sphingomonas sp. OTU376 TaxID=3043863 RepID=UPI00313C92D3